MTKTFLIDFDNTIVKSDFPRIGPPNPGAIETIQELLLNHIVLLNTQRTGKLKKEALKYTSTFGLLNATMSKLPPHPFNPDKPIVYIDDLAPGIPLLPDKSVDWLTLAPLIK